MPPLTHFSAQREQIETATQAQAAAEEEAKQKEGAVVGAPDVAKIQVATTTPGTAPETESSDWKSAQDPATGRTYMYNTKTNETKWTSGGVQQQNAGEQAQGRVERLKKELMRLRAEEKALNAEFKKGGSSDEKLLQKLKKNSENKVHIKQQIAKS